MTNIKKTALSLLVGAMAIGFSAFINAPKKSQLTTARYYNTSGIVGDTNPAHFVYQDNGTDLCITSAKECSAEWTTNNAPAPGQTPAQAGSPNYAGNTSLGTYTP
jgi:hypothetical protein